MNTAILLPREFYLDDTVMVARNLLGKQLVRKVGRAKISGTITETEAYRHSDDPASHAFKKITERNKIMFGQIGCAYVYFTYGMYFCFNVVARDSKTAAGAVLIRAIKPVEGIEMMQKNRGGSTSMRNLANGPGKLTQALGITKKDYGTDLTKDSRLYISEGIKADEVIASPRVGISKATEKLWNFRIQI